MSRVEDVEDLSFVAAVVAVLCGAGLWVLQRGWRFLTGGKG